MAPIATETEKQLEMQRGKPLHHDGSPISTVSDSQTLSAMIRPICVSMLEEIGYKGAPQVSDEAIVTLLSLMEKRANELRVPLDNILSTKGFRLGFSEGLLAHPNHPVEVQAYIGITTWLVVQFDDIVGQRGQMMNEAGKFHQRFFRGEPQPDPLLDGIAIMIREAYQHFDPVLATLVQTSILHFVTSNLLEQTTGFKNKSVSQAGEKFPYYFRSMSGMDVAYAIFAFPQSQYPDTGKFLEAIPDMAMFINMANDVLSFYKEELEGDKHNYMHNRARHEGRSVFYVLETVTSETVESARRVATILEGTGHYAKAWEDCVRGYITMHTTNPRYRLSDLGLGEPHPLASFF